MADRSSSPFPQRRILKEALTSSNAEDSATFASNFKGSKKDLVAWVRRNNKGRKPGEMGLIGVNAAIKLWRQNNPVKVNKPKPESKTSDFKPSNITIQEDRDTFYNNNLEKGYFDDTNPPSAERAELHKKAVKSGYLSKLKDAVVNKYGTEYYNIGNEEDAQMAGNAMIDEDGKILPMSSASGQYSGSNRSNTPELGTALNMKKTRGYKMPGFGKR